MFRDNEGVSRGVDFFYGFEAALGRPMMLRLEGHAGSLGSAFVWQFRGTLGAMAGPVEIYGGYHHWGVGSVALGGPLLGARFWW